MFQFGNHWSSEEILIMKYNLQYILYYMFQCSKKQSFIHFQGTKIKINENMGWKPLERRLQVITQSDDCDHIKQFPLKQLLLLIRLNFSPNVLPHNDCHSRLHLLPTSHHLAIEFNHSFKKTKPFVSCLDLVQLITFWKGF